MNSLKEEVLRAFVLSQSLEPLAEKPGCTTRKMDSSPGTKLEYFLVSAVNSVWPIMDLIDRIIENNGQPDCVFDVAYHAQLRSTRNRNGGKVNYAQILMLIPLITAQCLLLVEEKDPYDVDSILDRVGDAMRSTTIKDVEYLQKFVDLSRQLSESHHQRMGTTRKQWRPQFVGTYFNVMDATQAGDFSHMIMATEIRDGYPRSRKIFYDLVENRESGIISHSEGIYHTLLSEFGRHDIAADCIVVGFYLVLISHRSEILFP